MLPVCPPRTVYLEATFLWLSVSLARLGSLTPRNSARRAGSGSSAWQEASEAREQAQQREGAGRVERAAKENRKLMPTPEASEESSGIPQGMHPLWWPGNATKRIAVEMLGQGRMENGQPQ